MLEGQQIEKNEKGAAEQEIGLKIFMHCTRLLGGEESFILKSKGDPNYIPIQILSKSTIPIDDCFKFDENIDLILIMCEKVEMVGNRYKKPVRSYVFRRIFYEDSEIVRRTTSLNPYPFIEEEGMNKSGLEELAEKIEKSDQAKALRENDTKLKTLEF
jgi:hypothetical protein